jgi:metal-sulfur cluster biosynthetic enzyme
MRLIHIIKQIKMKYENYQKAKLLIEMIQAVEAELKRVSIPNIKINIVNMSGGIMETIDIGHDSKSEYSKEGKKLIELMRSNLKSKIDTLKKDLELL